MCGSIVKTKKIVEEFMNDRKKLAEQVYVEDRFLVLNVRYEYNICLSRINNPTKLAWWIHHLSEKAWIEKEHINRIIELATKNMGLKMYEGEG